MLKTKTNAELLASFKKMNLIAREKHALKQGFTSSLLYMKFLEKDVFVAPKPKEKPSKSTKATAIIHIVDVLDKSGSMNSGNGYGASKIDTALSAINEGIEDLRKQPQYNYTYSLCLFSSNFDIELPLIRSQLSRVPVIKANANGGTALYDAIGETLKTVSEGISPEDKVLMNIYTDGQENSSRKYSKTLISQLIDSYKEKGFTVTFVGTDSDTKAVIRDLSIHSTNTLSYDGSASGLKMSMQATREARTSYSKNVAAGQDVSQGFYKNIIKK